MRWRRWTWAAVGLLLGAAGCAAPAPTAYQPIATDGTGYADLRLEDDRYEVRFVGNSATPRVVVERYLLFRAAEVTIAAGADWFRFLERRTEPLAALGAEAAPGGDAAVAAKRSARRVSAGAHRARANRARGGGGSRARAYRRAYRGHRAGVRGYRYGHGYRYGYGYRRSSSVRFGFAFGFPIYPYSYGPYYPYYPYGPYYPYPRPAFYEAVAEIVVFEGEKPADDPSAYDAREVIANLGPEIRRPPPPGPAPGAAAAAPAE